MIKLPDAIHAAIAQPPASEAREPETGTDEKPVTIPEVEIKEMREEGYRVKEAASATKTDTPLRDIPQSIQVVPEQVIRSGCLSAGR